MTNWLGASRKWHRSGEKVAVATDLSEKAIQKYRERKKNKRSGSDSERRSTTQKTEVKRKALIDSGLAFSTISVKISEERKKKKNEDA